MYGNKSRCSSIRSGFDAADEVVVLHLELKVEWTTTVVLVSSVVVSIILQVVLDDDVNVA